ncbi:hypothetical protein [Robinsoniella peoriensis]
MQMAGMIFQTRSSIENLPS